MSTSYYQFEWRQYSQPNRITRAVQRLILINTLVYALQLLVIIPFGYSVRYAVQPSGSPVLQWFALRPDWVLNYGALWQPVTYMFMHDGLMHLFTNMLILFFFGPEVERLLSTRKFYRFFFFCGIMGGAAAVLAFALTGDLVSVVGASGAVSGVLVAFAVAYPHREVFLFPFPVPIKAWFLVCVIIVLNIGFAGPGSTVSWQAHLGGVAAGFLYMKAVPRIRDWQEKRLYKASSGDDGDVDRLGEAVDNIFKFEQKGRKK